ncbi:MAG: histidine phosphatase family protein [Bacteroidota bacterium]|nr:histidine phosphatase family protein [Bacteroidota bacterium]
MKTLFLVRHAKSEPHFSAASDFNRRLNAKGIKDAAEMAKRLVNQNILIDQFASSPALRTKETAEIFISKYNRKSDEINLIPALYQALPETFEEIVSGLDDQFNRVAIFAHNPGITDYASSLTKTPVPHMSTSSIFAVTSDVKSWQDFPIAEKTFLFFDSPRAAD